MKEKTVSNFGRFWTVFRGLRTHGETEDLKRELVMQYTGGRTGSLREMTHKEYGELCAGLERMAGGREELRRQRSAALKLMQELGVDTTDWNRVDAFCREPRIAGKEFGKLRGDELADLTVRLRTMKRKGWSRKQKPSVIINILPDAATINYN